MHKGMLVVLVVALGAGAACPALAQDGHTPEQVGKLYDEALQSARLGKLDDAIRTWLDILDDARGQLKSDIHYNLGLAYKKLDRRPEAWFHLDAYVRAAGVGDSKARKALQDLEGSLEKDHVRVWLSCEPDGVRLDLGAAIRVQPFRCPLVWWFKPGKVTVTGSKDGYDTATVEREIASGKAGVTWTLQLTQSVAKALPAAAVEVPTPAVSDSGGPVAPVLPPGGVEAEADAVPADYRVIQWALIGAGAGMIVCGGVLTALGYVQNESLISNHEPKEGASNTDVQNAQDAYEDAFASEVEPFAIASYVLYGAGGAAAIGGLVWMLTDPGPAGSRGDVFVAPGTGGSPAGFTINMGF